MKLYEQQAAFAIQIADLIKYIWDSGYKCTFGEAYRTPEQAALYAQQGKGIKNSLHIQRLAIDLNLYSPEGVYLTKTEDYAQFGQYWESLDSKNRWGGKFTRADGNHFERKI